MRTAHVARDIVCRIKHCDRTVGELTFRVTTFKFCKKTVNLITYHGKTAEKERSLLHLIAVWTIRTFIDQINILVCIFNNGLIFFLDWCSFFGLNLWKNIQMCSIVKCLQLLLKQRIRDCCLKRPSRIYIILSCKLNTKNSNFCIFFIKLVMNTDHKKFIFLHVCLFCQVWDGLWLHCIIQATGQMQCKAHTSPATMTSDIQVGRALSLLSILAGLLGFVVALLGGGVVNCSGAPPDPSEPPSAASSRKKVLRLFVWGWIISRSNHFFHKFLNHIIFLNAESDF